MNAKVLLFCLVASFAIVACTPKTAQQTAATPAPTPAEATKPTPVDEKLSPCPNWSILPNKDEVETNYVLYRDFLKVNDWKQAYDYWQKVYRVAPAADGKRNTVFNDGIRFYEYFMTQTQDSIQIKGYIEAIFKMYEEMEQCYPEGSYADARKAFDLYYKYPNLASKEEIYALFKKTVDKEGLKTPDFVLNPFTGLLVDLYFEKKISMEEAQQYQQKIRDIVTNGLAKCKGKECDRWKMVEQYAPVRLEDFEVVKGFYDCAYYKAKYYGEFEAAPTDCDVIRDVYGRLRWANCPETDEQFRNLIRAGNENCAEGGSKLVRDANNCLQNADYTCAIENFEKAAAEETDNVKKAKYLLLIAKIYYSHLKSFSKARQYALKAAEANTSWGEPYILVGRLYASSGPLCGPGRGWDSQVVVWPAIDMWNKAKRVDSSAAGEANKWIGRYSQYMPTIEEIFQRNLKEGESYYVGCWIQESTTIRAAR